MPSRRSPTLALLLLLLVPLTGPGCRESVRTERVEELLGAGDGLMRNGRYAEALRVYGGASDIDPDDPEPLRKSALALVILRRDKEAVTNFEASVQLGASLPASELVFWATALQRVGRIDDAIAKYAEALEANPSETSAMNNLGILLVGREKDRARGVALLEKAVSLKPGDPNLVYNLGRAYQQSGRHEEAYNLIQRAVAATKPSAASYPARLARLREAEARLSRGAAPASAPNVLLIVIDTLRADHVGAYGYGRDTTPTLDALARKGVIFDNAISQAPWTAASVATMFTGLYPSVHGLDGGVQWGAGQASAAGALPFAVQKVLSPSQLTLAEVLRRRGYRTAGFVSNVYMNSVFGFAQGFEVYDDEHEDYSSDVTQVKRRAQTTNLRVFEWLDGAPDEPFFLLVHYNDPHWPYNPPAPHGQGYIADYRGHLTPKNTVVAVVRGDKPAPDLTEEDVAFLVGLYDGEIEYMDSQLAGLLERMDSIDLERPLLTVVTSDHGEEFFDHGSTNHGYTLYDEQIRVPLIVHYPGRLSPRRVEAQVRLVDLMPTILDLAGLGEASSEVQGTILVPLMEGTTRVGPGIALSESTYVGDQKSLRTEQGLKWIRSFEADETLLFDLREDPGERTNLAQTRASVARELQTQLERRVEANHALRQQIRPEGAGIEEIVLDPETTKRLQSLGYVE
jgi:arylsulfatase A-like enzyme/Flp pilus assembly protein TadD